MCFYLGDLVPSLVASLVVCAWTFATWRACAPIAPPDRKAAVGLAFFFVMLLATTAGTFELLHDWFVARVGTPWCVGKLALAALCAPPVLLLSIAGAAEARLDKHAASDEFDGPPWRSPTMRMLAGLACVVAAFAIFGR